VGSDDGCGLRPIRIDDIVAHVRTAHEGVTDGTNWGERGLFYNPGGRLPKGTYVLTFKEKDSENDKASNVDRPGVYRLNLGLSKPTFTTLFGAIPRRPPAGGIINTGHNFAALDTLTPHPHYGWLAWMCVLNPSPPTFEALKPLIGESVALAKARFERRTAR